VAGTCNPLALSKLFIIVKILQVATPYGKDIAQSLHITAFRIIAQSRYCARRPKKRQGDVGKSADISD